MSAKSGQYGRLAVGSFMGGSVFDGLPGEILAGPGVSVELGNRRGGDGDGTEPGSDCACRGDLLRVASQACG